jgi:hypothetical protein
MPEAAVEKPGPLAVARITVHGDEYVLVITSVTADDEPNDVTGNWIVSPLATATAEPPAD